MKLASLSREQRLACRDSERALHGPGEVSRIREARRMRRCVDVATGNKLSGGKPMTSPENVAPERNAWLLFEMSKAVRESATVEANCSSGAGPNARLSSRHSSATATRASRT